MTNFTTINVRGLRAADKMAKYFNFLRNKYYEVLALQETHSTKDCEKLWKSQWRGQIFYAHGESNSRGCAILIQRNVKTKVHKIVKDELEGRYLIIDIEVRAERFLLCCLYAPNSDSPQFFERVMGELDSFSCQNLVMMGDFNTVLEKTDKRSNVVGIGHPKCVKFLKEVMADRNLIDIWRSRNPQKFRFTWHTKMVRERLDYILIAGQLTANVLDCDIDPAFLADHAIPHLTFKDVTSPVKGPGYWKLNTKLLDIEHINQRIKAVINQVLAEDMETCEKWEYLKVKMRGEFIKMGARNKKAQENLLEVLMMKQYRLQKEADSQEKIFKDLENQLVLVQKDIEDIVQKRTYFAKKTNEVKWHEFGEKPSSYFCSLEKPRVRTPIGRISLDDNIIEDQEIILEELYKYYARLFSDKRVYNDNFLNTVELPKISQDDRNILESPISLDEIEIAVKQMAKEKCPGIDGYQIEFYDKFLSQIKYILHSVYLKCIETGSFHYSARTGIISLLDKPGKDQLKIENWRPLTLLCCDYKIYAKILANRLSSVINDLIHEDQSGFIRGRFIAQNLMDLQSVIEQANID